MPLGCSHHHYSESVGRKWHESPSGTIAATARSHTISNRTAGSRERQQLVLHAAGLAMGLTIEGAVSGARAGWGASPFGWP